MNNKIPSQLSDSELVAEVTQLAAGERRSTVALIAHLAEMDARRLYRGAGFPSMFVYCTQVRRLSGGGAYNRIEAARVARRFPSVLDLLAQGVLNLATVRILAPHLTPDNHEMLLAAASHKGKRDVEELVARVSPKPDVAPSVRKLPDRKPPDVGFSALDAPAASTDLPTELGMGAAERLEGSLMPAPGVPSAGPETRVAAMVGPPREGAPSPAAARHPLVAALSPDRYQIRFTASASTCEKLRLAQDLLRHAVPNGNPAEIFDRALTALLEDLGRRKFAATGQPRSSCGVRASSRGIPASVKRSVVARGGGRCAFTASDGRRCGERGFLELHHVVPYAHGGPATEANIQLRCRAHNGYEAELCFGNGTRGRGGREQLAPGRVGLAQGQIDHPPHVLARGAVKGNT